WTLRDACVWHKPNPMPESVAGTRWEGDTLRRGSWRHTSAHEMVFMLTRGMGYFADQEAVREENSESSGGWQTRAKRGLLRSYANGYGGNSETMQSKRDGSPAEDGLGGVAGQNPSGRNPRNVWSITTRPYSGAHFATMPPDLAERCIKAATSAKGVCPACGAQWAPVVERVPVKAERERNVGGRMDGFTRMPGGQAEWDARPGRTVLGHRPTCNCPPADPIPATVLDPFGGAGTTALVADRLGRDAIICELNADYSELARARVAADAPMFAAVEVKP
ncbi:MAG: site-specific DNA-methyltransferase, partial [Myxococcales bacterium]|nr:site-specific DNA-methyltransferase [Myxococcales bacterium]